MAPTRRKKPNFQPRLSNEQISTRDCKSNTRGNIFPAEDVPMTSKMHLQHRRIQHYISSSQLHLAVQQALCCHHHSSHHRHHHQTQPHQEHQDNPKTDSMTDRRRGGRRRFRLPLLVTVVLLVLLALPGPSTAKGNCPRPCRCRARGFVDCGFRSLNYVPRGIPRHVQRLWVCSRNSTRIWNVSNVFADVGKIWRMGMRKRERKGENERDE